MGTLAEEILSRNIGRRVKAGEIILASPDRIMSHDTMSWLAIEAMKQLAVKPYDPEKMVIVFDHIVPPATIEQAKIQRKVMDFMQQNDIKNFYQEGICHQILVEKGLVKPGDILIGTDSHTCTAGALGVFATGMGATDIGIAYATGKTWFRIPESIRVNIDGAFRKGVYVKDLMMKIIETLGVEGANYKSIEFTGKTIKDMELHERLTLTNMAVEAGAKTGLIEADKKALIYLKEDIVNKDFIKAENGIYEKEFDFNVNNLEPLIAFPHDLDKLHSISEANNIKIDQVFIGTCTNGRFEDLEIAAGILKNKKVNRFTRTIITPASVEIFQRAMKKGFINIFQDAGCIVTNPGCGPCLGRHQGVLAPGEKALTTMNRNFKGRMGSSDAEIYLASPATCAASAITGYITDPRDYL